MELFSKEKLNALLQEQKWLLKSNSIQKGRNLTKTNAKQKNARIWTCMLGTVTLVHFYIILVALLQPGIKNDDRYMRIILLVCEATRKREAVTSVGWLLSLYLLCENTKGSKKKQTPGTWGQEILIFCRFESSHTKRQMSLSIHWNKSLRRRESSLPPLRVHS